PYPDSLDKREPDEAALVRRLIRDLRKLEKELLDPAKYDAEETIPEDVLRALADIGMFGISIPKKYGGLGLSATGYGRVFAALCSIDPSLGVVVGVHCGVGAKSIVLFGDREQKNLYLPKLANAEFFAAYALTEPNVGSDAQHVQA